MTGIRDRIVNGDRDGEGNGEQGLRTRDREQGPGTGTGNRDWEQGPERGTRTRDQEQGPGNGEWGTGNWKQGPGTEIMNGNGAGPVNHVILRSAIGATE